MAKMKEQILKISDPLKEGRIIERENRFILKVEFEDGEEKVYLANPGALSTVLVPKRVVLCKRAEDENRKTRYDAFAIKVDDFYVTVKSVFANLIFSKILEKEMIQKFQKYSLISREPSLPDEGRADFLLKNPKNGKRGFVEVKSCTHVENGVAKFPDRPTKRGRRHLKSLVKLEGEKWNNHIVFVVQRKDAEKFKPFKEVDPKFAELLTKVRKRGVDIHAFSTEFVPPDLYLADEDLPINLE